MTGLRRSVIFMVVFLTVFFNIERLDYGDMVLVDLQTFVYVLVSIQVLSTVLLRPLQKIPIQAALALWFGVYFAIKLTYLSSRPLVGGIYTYLLITEMSMIAIAMLLTMDLSRKLNEFEGFAARTIFPRHNYRVKDLHEAEEDIKTEFIRSRRHNRALSVLIVEMDQHSIKKNIEQGFANVQQLMMKRFILASLEQVLIKVVRRTDVILEPNEQDGFILFCPETTADGAILLAHRIQAMAQKDMGLTVQCGIASFPEDAVTFDDLLKKAHRNIAESGETSQATITSSNIVNDYKK